MFMLYSVDHYLISRLLFILSYCVYDRSMDQLFYGYIRDN